MWHTERVKGFEVCKIFVTEENNHGLFRNRVDETIDTSGEVVWRDELIGARIQ
jgi:hypothetical protein